jgi:hypothetical protein
LCRHTRTLAPDTPCQRLRGYRVLHARDRVVLDLGKPHQCLELAL